MQEQFGKRFQDLRQHEGKFRLFSNPLHANLQSIPERFQNEVIELQSNLEASQAFNHMNLLDFYKKFIKKIALQTCGSWGLNLPHYLDLHMSANKLFQK